MKNNAEIYVKNTPMHVKKMLHQEYIAYINDNGWLGTDSELQRYVEIFIRKENLSCAMFPFVLQQIMFEIYKEFYECHI